MKMTLCWIIGAVLVLVFWLVVVLPLLEPTMMLPFTSIVTSSESGKSTWPAVVLNKPGVTKRLSPYYAIEDGDVYFIDPTNTKIGKEILDADPYTFRAINPHQLLQLSLQTCIYGTDKSHVWFQYLLIPGADPQTFVIVNADDGLSKDNGHVYIQALVYLQLDPTTVLFLGDNSGVQATNSDNNLLAGVFYLSSRGELYSFGLGNDTLYNLPTGDPASFQIIRISCHSAVFAKDKNNVYCNGQVLAGANPATFMITDDGATHPVNANLDQAYIVAQDGGRTYDSECQIVG